MQKERKTFSLGLKVKRDPEDLLYLTQRNLPSKVCLTQKSFLSSLLLLSLYPSRPWTPRRIGISGVSQDRRFPCVGLHPLNLSCPSPFLTVPYQSSRQTINSNITHDKEGHRRLVRMFYYRGSPCSTL